MDVSVLYHDTRLLQRVKSAVAIQHRHRRHRRLSSGPQTDRSTIRPADGGIGDGCTDVEMSVDGSKLESDHKRTFQSSSFSSSTSTSCRASGCRIQRQRQMNVSRNAGPKPRQHAVTSPFRAVARECPPSPKSSLYQLPVQLLVTKRTPDYNSDDDSAISFGTNDDDDDDDDSGDYDDEEEDSSEAGNSDDSVSIESHDSSSSNNRTSSGGVIGIIDDPNDYGRIGDDRFRPKIWKQKSDLSLLSNGSSALSSRSRQSRNGKEPKPFVPRYHSDIQYRTALFRSASSSSSLSSVASGRSGASTMPRKGPAGCSMEDRVRGVSATAMVSETAIESPVKRGNRDSRLSKGCLSLPFPSPRPSRTGKLDKYVEYGDQDVWVERFFMNKKLEPVTYFRSVNTGRCVRYEPPTGASRIVYLEDLVAGNGSSLRDPIYSANSLDRAAAAAVAAASAIGSVQYAGAALSPMGASLSKHLGSDRSPEKEQQQRHRRQKDRNSSGNGSSEGGIESRDQNWRNSSGGKHKGHRRSHRIASLWSPKSRSANGQN